MHGLLSRTVNALAQVDKRSSERCSSWHTRCAATRPRSAVAPRQAKKYLLAACTQRYTLYHLGDRSLATFKDFDLGEPPGVAVHDRYQNCDWAVFAGLVHRCVPPTSFVISRMRGSANSPARDCYVDVG